MLIPRLKPASYHCTKVQPPLLQYYVNNKITKKETSNQFNVELFTLKKKVKLVG